MTLQNGLVRNDILHILFEHTLLAPYESVLLNKQLFAAPEPVNQRNTVTLSYGVMRDGIVVCQVSVDVVTCQCAIAMPVSGYSRRPQLGGTSSNLRHAAQIVTVPGPVWRHAGWIAAGHHDDRY
jgi:hypothetical protein